jgi:hypothetical protein
MSSSRSSSKQESQTTTTTTSNDKRIVADAQATVLSMDNAEGAIFNITQDATNGEGFGRLLDLAEGLFVGGGQMVQSMANSTQDSLEKINTAANDKEGAIDQKTILILACAGAAAVYFAKGRK